MSARTRLGLLIVLVTTALLIGAGPAGAAPQPWWHLTQRLVPSRVQPEGEATLVVQAVNLGDEPASAAPAPLLRDTLPPGFSVVEGEEEGEMVPQVSFFAYSKGGESNELGLRGFFGRLLRYCEAAAQEVTCKAEPAPPFNEGEFAEFFSIPPLAPYEYLEMRVKVKAGAGAVSGEVNEFAASGGGVTPATLRSGLPLGSEAVPFGIEHFSLRPEEEGGQTATRAGSHPYQLTTDVTFNRSSAETLKPPALPRDLHFSLPAGQLGNATVTPICSALDFGHIEPGGSVNACPADTVIGATILTFSTTTEREEHSVVPIFNLAPPPGEPARFGFEALRNPVILDTALRSGKGEDYGITVNASNITELVGLQSATSVFWGAPASSSHDASRGWACIVSEHYAKLGETSDSCTPSGLSKPPAFLTLPTNCAAPFTPTVAGTSWPTAAAPEGFSFAAVPSLLQSAGGEPLSIGACNQVPFDPHIHSEPTSDAATSPTGLSFDIDVEDAGLTNEGGVAQSQIKRAVVTLPQGFTTNPSVAEGLKACSEGEYDESTLDGSKGCNQEAKVGEVAIESPLVAQKIIGALYVAKQGENPYGNLLTLYLVARNPELGVMIKQALKVTPDPVTGQLTTEVDNVPQLPFSHFHLSFRQGQRSPLVTPPACGTYTVQADLYPWSNPSTPVRRESSFRITQGPEGQPCPSGGLPPFHPELIAGSENPAAGTYSPFYTHLTRKDSEQEITHFSIKLPPGVSGKLAGIPYCPDAGIAAAKAREREGGGTEEEQSPSCPAATEIGHSLVGSGVGNVLAYVPGKLYLAGPYHGSNLSIVSITAAKVGPFDLGTVVVRFALRINPETAEVFVDSQGSDPIPHIVDGIPVHLRDIRSYVDRPDFTLNPTSCEQTSTASTVLGSGLNFASETDDQPVTVTSPFQAADCASLGFKPRLSLSLIGGTKRGGTPKLKAVLHARPGDANIGRAQVTLPRSEFLDNAHIGTVCTRVQFKEGVVPGEKCPAASIYGRAEAITPLLSEPLEGPVYLRSSEHELPDLVVALHNNQVDIALDGRIDSLKGQIRNTFEAVPDAPVTKFTLTMQGGKKGLLENSTDLCKGTHRAEANFTGQNGKLHDFRPVLKPQCGKKGKKKHKDKGRKRRHG